jgi:spermidine synthase
MQNQPASTVEAAFWIQNLIDGNGGLTIKIKRLVAEAASPFQKIEVLESFQYGRILVLGGTIALTEKDEFIYSEMISHPAVNSHSQPQKVCIIGGGDGACLKEVLKYGQVEGVDVVEIDQLVTKMVKAHFPGLAGGFDDKRTSLVFADGYEWIKAKSKNYDVIIVDSYDHSGPIQSLSSADFFASVKKALVEKGVAVFQLNSPELDPGLTRRTLDNLSEHFKFLRPYVAAIPSFPLGICGFVTCSNTEMPTAIDQFKTVAKECHYYNDAVHRGAFLLPTYLKQILDTDRF